MATLPGEKTQEDVAALRVDDGHLKLSVAPPPAPQEVQTEELLAQKPDVAEPQEVQPKEVQEVQPEEVQTEELLAQTPDATEPEAAPTPQEAQPDPVQDEEEPEPSEEEMIRMMLDREKSDSDMIGEMIAKRDRGILRDAIQAFIFEIATVIDNLGTNPLGKALDALPGGDSEKYPSPKDSLLTMLREFDMIPQKGDEPNTFAWDTGKFVGGTAAFLPFMPLLPLVGPATKLAPIWQTFAEKGVTQGAAQIFKKGGQLVKQGISETGKAARNNTGKFVISELALATGAGIGIEIAKEKFPDSLFAEFVGGVLGATAPQLTVTGIAIKSARIIRERLVAFFSKKGAAARATGELKRLATDPKKAAESIDGEEIIHELTGITSAAEKTGDPGILAIEAEILKTGGQSKYSRDQHLEQMMEIIEESMVPSPGLISRTAETLAHQMSYLKDLLDSVLHIAANNADAALAKIGPSATVKQANAIVKQELEAAEVLARTDEKTLWAVVNRSDETSATITSDVLRKELNNRSLGSDPLDFPPDLTLDNYFGRFDEKGKFVKGILTDKATMGALQDVRSRVLRAIREERAKPVSNDNKIRILDDLQEALLTDLGTMGGKLGTPAGDALRLALDFSRKTNEIFKRGIVGKVKGVDKTGTPAIQEGLILFNTFSSNPIKGAENVRRIVRATKGVEGKTPASPELLVAMEDYVKKEFMDKVVRGGKIDPAKGERYIKANMEFLEEFPELLDDLKNAIKTEDIRVIKQRRVQRYTYETVTKKSMSKAVLFVFKGPKKAFEAIEDSKPAEFERSINDLLKKVNKDPTGEALEGLQSSFFQWVKERSSVSGRLSLRKIKEMIKDQKIAAMAGKILNKGQIERLRKIVNSLDLVDKIKRTEGVETKILEKTDSRLLRDAAALVGAMEGRRFGTGTIQAPEIMANRFRDLAKLIKFSDPGAKLFLDAFMDDTGETLKMLLMNTDTPESLKLFKRRLNVWVAKFLFDAGETSLVEHTGDSLSPSLSETEDEE